MNQADLFLLFEKKNHLLQFFEKKKKKKKKKHFRHFVFFLKIEYGFIFRIHFRFNLCIQNCSFHFFLFAQAGLVFVA